MKTAQGVQTADFFLKPSKTADFFLKGEKTKTADFFLKPSKSEDLFLEREKPAISTSYVNYFLSDKTDTKTKNVLFISQNILLDSSLSDQKKIQTWYEYLSETAVSGGYALSVVGSWVWSSAKVFGLLAAFYALGSVAAAAAAAGSAGHFLSILTSLGYGGVTLSGPLLAMLTKGLGASLVKGLGANITIAGALALAKKAGATKFLERKLDDGYVKSFFVRLGVDPKLVSNETVVRELANVFLTVAPAAIATTGFLPAGMMFLAGDPITTLGFGYAIRAGTTAISKVSLKGAVTSVVDNTRKIKDKVVEEVLGGGILEDEKELMVETKEKLDEIVNETIEESQVEYADISIQETLIEGNTLHVPETIVPPAESRMALGVAKAMGLAAVMMAFSTSGVVDFGVMAQVGGQTLTNIAQGTMSSAVSVAQSETAQMFALNTLGGKAVGALYKKIWGDKNKERESKMRGLYNDYKKAVAEGQLKEASTIAAKFWGWMRGSSQIYTADQLEKMDLSRLQKIARNMGFKGVTDDVKKLKAFIVVEQVRKLNEINDAVSGALSSVALLAASHVVAKGLQNYQSGELQNLINDQSIPTITPPEKLELVPEGIVQEGETGFKLGSGQSASELKQSAEAAKLALKEAQKQARVIEEAQKELQRQIEFDLADQRFKKSLAQRLAEGKTVGGTTILESGEPITGFDFSTNQLMEQIDREFGNTNFNTVIDMFASTAGWGAVGKVLDYVPGLNVARTALSTTQYAQTTVDILEKVNQLTSQGLGKVAQSGFEKTYASTFEGVQQITGENVAKFAGENFGEVGKAFKTAWDAAPGAKTNAAIAIKSIVMDMLKNNEEITKQALFTRIGKMMIVGDETQAGTMAAMGKQLYEVVMGPWV